MLMKLFFLTFLHWQHGVAVSCDACGADAQYSESISTEGGLAKRTVTTNACPNHYNYCTGKPGPTCGDIGAEGSATEAESISTTYEIPAEPVLKTSGTTSVECEMGAIAVALNGVSIYSGAVDGQCNKVDVDDDTSEWTSFDFCSGHVAPGGDYHYHFPPTCLVTQAMEIEAKTASDHSPQIGWALDGFPIYGPYGSGGNLMSNADSCSGSYCLDECSGKEEELPSVDNFKYRYYMTGAIGDLSSLPGDPKPSADDYPYSLDCYKGCQWDELSSGACSGDQGVSDSYSATALSGYTTKYVAPNNLQCGSGESTDAGSDEDTSPTPPANDAGTSTDAGSDGDTSPTPPFSSNDAGTVTEVVPAVVSLVLALNFV